MPSWLWVNQKYTQSLLSWIPGLSLSPKVQFLSVLDWSFSWMYFLKMFINSLRILYNVFGSYLPLYPPLNFSQIHPHLPIFNFAFFLLKK